MASGELRWRLLIVRESVLNIQGRRAEQREALDALQALADAQDDDTRRAFVARKRSHVAMRMADYRTQETLAREAIRLAERAGDAECKLDAQRLLADALGAQGQHAAGKAIAREGLAEARSLGLRRAEGVFLNTLSYIASEQDDQVTGLALDLEDLPIWRELGDPLGESVALGNIGGDWLWFGELGRRGAIDDALRVSRSIGARFMQLGPLGDLSEVALREGDARRRLRSRARRSTSPSRCGRSISRRRLFAGSATRSWRSGITRRRRRPTSAPRRWDARSDWGWSSTRGRVVPGWLWRGAMWRARCRLSRRCWRRPTGPWMEPMPGSCC